MDINEVRDRLELAVSAGEHVPVVRAIVESDDLLALLADHARLKADAERLNFLDGLSESYGTHIHEGNRWEIYGAYRNVRDAIDAAKAVQP